MALVLVTAALVGCSPTGGGAGPSKEPAPTATATPDLTSPPPVVATTGGRISGVRTGQMDRYHGIPFAAPPVGPLRFAAPRPALPWQGIRDGDLGGPSCKQNGPFDNGSSEDCLYLSVGRPAGVTLTGRLPVILWIHGGAFVGGTGESFDPSALVAAGPAIVVTTNYRLGPLGYLALPSMGGGDAGNFATEDLVAALDWIHANAAAFGGDPGNVTIAGESAGSVNVCALLAAPTATGLFQRAIMESGPCTWKLPTLAQAGQTGLAFAARLGCVDPATALDCLRAQPADALLAADATDQTEIFQPFTFSPTTGGTVLPLTPSQALWDGKLAHVPLLMGTIHDEGRPFTNYWAGQPITDAVVDSIIASHFPDRVDRVLAAYPAGQVPPRERLARIITDDMFTCQTTTFAQLTAGVTQQPTYLYELDVPDTPATGATHGRDLDFLFPPTVTPDPTSQAGTALSDTMVHYWTRFAATGDPNTSSRGGGVAPRALPAWPRFAVNAVHGGTDRVLLTPAKIAAVSGTWTEHHCDVWG
jgi:para-nitrobenzyl esterase